MAEYKTRNTCNLLERQCQCQANKCSRRSRCRNISLSVRECVGLQSPVSVSGGEGEHPVPAPGQKQMKTKWLTSTCDRGAKGRKFGRPCATRTPSGCQAGWAESKKLGWSNISIHGKYKQIEIFFLTWNDFYIAGTINCFRIKNVSA